MGKRIWKSSTSSLLLASFLPSSADNQTRKCDTRCSNHCLSQRDSTVARWAMVTYIQTNLPVYIYICLIHMIYIFIYPGFTTFRKCEKKPFTQNVFYLKWTKYFSQNCGFDFLAFAKINNVCLFNNSLFLPYNSLYLCLIWIRVLKHVFPNPKDVAEYLVTSLLQGIRY